MVKIVFTGRYYQMYRKLVKNSPELKQVVNTQVKKFQNRPKDTRLDNHELKRYMKGKWAFSITDDIRIIYEWKDKNVVRFLAIGTHPEVYRKN